MVLNNFTKVKEKDMKKVALIVDNSGSLTKKDLEKINVTKLIPISFACLNMSSHSSAESWSTGSPSLHASLARE